MHFAVVLSGEGKGFRVPNRARRSGFAKKIETVHWTTGGFSTTALGAGATAQLIATAQHLPETLLRTRGSWAARLASGLGDGIGVILECGIIQVPEGTGTTVLWSPGTDGDAPWIWWDTMILMYGEYVVDAVWPSNVSDGQRIIDSKAMRRLRNTEIQFVAENSTISGFTGSSVAIAAQVRILSGS